MLIQGLLMLVAGMGIVLVFLQVMIVVMDVSARFVSRFNYLMPEATSRKPMPKAAVQAAPAELAVAIAAAASRQRVG